MHKSGENGTTPHRLHPQSQERLSDLAMISIENKYLDKLNYDDLIEEFASRNARRSNFLGVRLC